MYQPKTKVKKIMPDISTMIIAGAGGLSLTFAFVDYQLSRKRKTETR
jgi:hypothetical protein